MFRTSMGMALAGAVCTVTMFTAVGPAQAAADGFSAEGLEAGTEVMFANVPSRMFECWEDGLKGAPRLYQRVSGRWRLLDVATVSRDVASCGSRTPNKALYEFTLLPVGRINVAKDYYEARVLTKCDGCEVYRWKIPFRTTDETF